ncbi:hypothetical protein [Paenibacillus sp. EPM92]|uniref:hypothetical protein n=1 Tax=Paenibacillus sp. EPM92 TaxID=1561195 RepID=UPI00191576B2|nr:hypothetical protein [Paenibacillus sp. EPM92]
MKFLAKKDWQPKDGVSNDDINRWEGGIEDANNEKASTVATLKRSLQNFLATQTGLAFPTFYGRTLVNLLGKDGGCESITPFTSVGGGTVSLSTTQKKSGSNSFKITTSSNAGYTYKDYTYPLDTAKQYVLAGWVFIESYTSGNVRLVLRDVGTTTDRYSTTADSATVGSWQFVYVKIPTSNTLVGTGFRLTIGMTGATTTAVAYFDDIRLYELSSTDYSAIGTTYTATTSPSIDDFIPYVDGIQHVVNPALTKVGRNQFPPFTDPASSLHANAVATEPYKLTLNATADGQVSFVDVPVLPNTIYSISVVRNGRIVIDERDSSGAPTKYAVNETSNANGTMVTSFTTAATTVKLRFYFTNTGAGTFTFSNPMIVLGTAADLPPSFEPRADDYVYGVSNSDGRPLMLASNIDGSVRDSLYRRDGVWYKFKRMQPDEPLIVVSNTATLAIDAAANTAIIQDKTNGDIYKRVATLSGSGKEFTQGGTGNRTITFNAGNAPTAGEANYQISKPVEEIVTVEGAITLQQGGNALEMAEGVIVREPVSPQQDSVSKNWYINEKGLNASIADNPLKNRTDKILKVYKNGTEDKKWSIYTHSSNKNGIGMAYISNSDYDQTAEYTVTYLALDKYGLTANVVDATLEHWPNVGSAVAVNARTIADMFPILGGLRAFINSIYASILKLGTDKYDKTGGALTGVVQTNIGTNPSGAPHHIFAATNGSKRFATGLTANETGANTGSDFAIWRYADDGNFIDEGMRIGRDDGRVNVPGDFNAGKGYLWNNVLMARTRVNNGVLEYDTTGLGGWRPVGMLRIGASNTVQDDLPTTRSLSNGVMLVGKILPKGIGDLLITGEIATTSVPDGRLLIIQKSTDFIANRANNGDVDWRTPIGTNIGLPSYFTDFVTVMTTLENQAFTAFSETIHTRTNEPLYLVLTNDSGGTIQIRNLQIKYDIIG